MDSVDKVIWILPALAVFDVISTLYALSSGGPLSMTEVGYFASIFAEAGLIYVYIPIYVLVIVGFAYVLWQIKNTKLDRSVRADKILFVALVCAACYIYMAITTAFIGNLFMAAIRSRGINWNYIRVLIYVSTIFSLVTYVWHDVKVWVKSDNEKEQ